MESGRLRQTTGRRPEAPAVRDIPGRALHTEAPPTRFSGRLNRSSALFDRAGDHADEFLTGDVRRSRAGDDIARAHDPDLRRKPFDLLEIVGDHQHGVALADDPPDEVLDLRGLPQAQ